MTRSIIARSLGEWPTPFFQVTLVYSEEHRLDVVVGQMLG